MSKFTHWSVQRSRTAFDPSDAAWALPDSRKASMFLLLQMQWMWMTKSPLTCSRLPTWQMSSSWAVGLWWERSRWLEPFGITSPWRAMKSVCWYPFTRHPLRCPCKILVHRLCPWHAAERHLIRVNCITQGPSRSNFPLIPDRHGGVVTKLAMVTALRNLLKQVGIQVHITTDEDKQIPRFGGHSVRVSGAMMLASAKVPVHLIQLMGRWSSAAVERYVQAAPMVALPSLPSGVLGQVDVSLPSALGSSSSAMSQTPTMTSVPQTPNNIPTATTRDSRVSEVKNRLGHLEEEVVMIRELIKKPEISLIVRPRSRVVHKPSVDEQSNLPQVWQTKCGWSYGCTKFFRLQVLDSGFQPCKKCFPEQDGSFTADPDIDGSSGSDPSSSDSSSSEESGWAVGLNTWIADISVMSKTECPIGIWTHISPLHTSHVSSFRNTSLICICNSFQCEFRFSVALGVTLHVILEFRLGGSLKVFHLAILLIVLDRSFWKEHCLLELLVLTSRFSPFLSVDMFDDFMF